MVIPITIGFWVNLSHPEMGGFLSLTKIVTIILPTNLSHLPDRYKNIFLTKMLIEYLESIMNLLLKLQKSGRVSLSNILGNTI